MSPEDWATRVIDLWAPGAPADYYMRLRERIAGAVRAAVLDEREACARLVDATEHAGWYRPDYPAAEFVGDVGETLERAAAAIRARGTKA
jgi:hypothetical protein